MSVVFSTCDCVYQVNRFVLCPIFVSQWKFANRINKTRVDLTSISLSESEDLHPYPGLYRDQNLGSFVPRCPLGAKALTGQALELNTQSVWTCYETCWFTLC